MATSKGTDWTSGLSPESVANQVMSAVEEESALMALADVRRMPARTEYVPLTTAVPSAQWIDVGERKAYGEIVWSAEKLVARELAVVTYIEDATWRMRILAEADAQRLLASAISRELDRAVLFGAGPAGFPPDGIVGTSPVTGEDVPSGIEAALALIESTSVRATGIIPGRGSSRACARFGSRGSFSDPRARHSRPGR